MPDATISSRDICNQAVVERILADGAVASIKIAADIQSDTYDGGVIATDSGTTGWRIERNTGNAVFDGLYVRGALSAATIAAANITAGTLGAGVIYAGTINADNITTGTLDDPGVIISGDRITTGTINANNATITNINASNISSGSMGAGYIGAGTIGVHAIYLSNNTNSFIASNNGVTWFIKGDGTAQFQNVQIKGLTTGSVIDADYITTGALDADLITAGELRGRLVTTGLTSTVTRVEMDTTNDDLRFYSGSSLRGRVDVDGTGTDLSMISETGTDVILSRAGVEQLFVESGGIRLKTSAGNVLDCSNNGPITAYYQITGPNGSNTDCTFGFSSEGLTSNTGMFRIGSDNLGLAAGGSTRVDINTSRTFFQGPIYMNNGTAGAPSYAFNNSTNSGMSWTGTELGLANGGSWRLLINSSGHTYPNADNAQSCGIDAREWKDVWATDTTINSSDLARKKSVKALQVDAAAFVDSVRPIQFKWRGKNGRRHFGFDMDTIEAAVVKFGDFAGFVDPNINRDPTLPEPDGPLYKGLRIGELVPVLWAAVQQLQERVRALEAI